MFWSWGYKITYYVHNQLDYSVLLKSSVLSFGTFLGGVLKYSAMAVPLQDVTPSGNISHPSVLYLQKVLMQTVRESVFLANMALWDHMFSKNTSCPRELPKVGARDTVAKLSKHQMQTVYVPLSLTVTERKQFQCSAQRGI